MYDEKEYVCSYISKLLGKIKGEIILTFLLEKPIALITTCGAMWAICQVAQIYAKSCLKQGHKNNNIAVSFHIFGMVQQLIDLSRATMLFLFGFYPYMINIWKWSKYLLNLIMTNQEILKYGFNQAI